MKNGRLLALLLLLIGAAGVAGVYKWVDESGKVHFGDAPPEGGAVQSVDIPEAPSQEKIEKARRQMRERMDRYEQFSEDVGRAEPVEQSPPEAEERPFEPASAECFTPLSDLVKGPSGEVFTPISQRPLAEEEQELLTELLAEMAGNWRGAITRLTCSGSLEEPARETEELEANAIADWNPDSLRLGIETEYRSEENRSREKLFHWFEVGDALFFNDNASVGVLAQEDNQVEVLALEPDGLAFLVKRRILTRHQARIPRAEIRYLEVHDRSLSLTELYYSNGILTGFDTWELARYR